MRAVPLDWNRVEVSWDAPYYPGGDLITYTIYLRRENDETDEIRKDIKADKNKR